MLAFDSKGQQVNPPTRPTLPPPITAVNGGGKVGRVGGRLLSIGDRILYRLPSFIGL